MRRKLKESSFKCHVCRIKAAHYKLHTYTGDYLLCGDLECIYALILGDPRSEIPKTWTSILWHARPDNLGPALKHLMAVRYIAANPDPRAGMPTATERR